MIEMISPRYRRSVVLTGVSLVVLSGFWPARAESTRYYDGLARMYDTQGARSSLTARRNAAHKGEKQEKVALPAGPLQIVVSIDRQRATLFANGRPVASGPVSTGTKTHPTPMGVFTV